MITWQIGLLFLFIHWIADFVLQTDWQAKNKSTNNSALTAHVGIYSLCWVLPLSYLLGVPLGILASACIFLMHWVTDFSTSRLNTYLYKKGDIHNFFVSIGFDQILHYVQIAGIYLILKG